MKWLANVVLALFCAAVAVDARAQLREGVRDAISRPAHYSLSGQFVIHDAPSTPFYSPPNDVLSNRLQLNPTLLAVSCERVRKEFLNQLGLADEWNGNSRIYIELHHFRDASEDIVITPSMIGGKWVYRLEMPDILERSRVVYSVVSALLLEMANRDSDRCAEIPVWLAEGLSQEILFSSKTDLVIDSPMKSENGIPINRIRIEIAAGPPANAGDSAGMEKRLLSYLRRADPLAAAHDDFQTMAPLTLEQLSWPGRGQFEGMAGEDYRSSAQLMWHDLCQLPDGRATLVAFIHALPKHLNWQLTFLQSFHADFATQLEFEKWWALQVVQFTGHDLEQTWPSDESWSKLDEVIRPAVEVRSGDNDIPFHSQVTLQAIIKDWQTSQQVPFLQDKIRQLAFLRLRISPRLAALVAEYQHALEYYVERRSQQVIVPMGRIGALGQFDSIAREAIRALDSLDARRQQLRPPVQPSSKVASSQDANN